MSASDADPAAILADWRDGEQAADPGPWTIAARHGRDIADEAWSSEEIRNAAGQAVAITYETNVLEHDDDGAAPFIVTARTAMPLLLDAVETALKLHARQEKPVRSWDLELRCAAHMPGPALPLSALSAIIRDCPDCRYREYWVCSRCRCPDDEWPCAEYRAITTALTGKGEGNGLEASS